MEEKDSLLFIFMFMHTSHAVSVSVVEFAGKKKKTLVCTDNMNLYLMLRVKRGCAEEFKCGLGTVGYCANLSSEQGCETGTQLKH